VTSTTLFSAAGSALGYLYQVRLALLWALRRWKTGDEFQVSLETLDDVTFETGATATDLLQTKHHLNAQAVLTDSSPDLWKSLRIWFEGQAIGSIPRTAELHLLTTAVAAPGSIAHRLKAGPSRDVTKALTALNTTATTSVNETNESAYASFLKVDEAVRKSLVERITVYDSASNVVDIGIDLRQEVFAAADRNHLEPFLERLEGWWFRRCLTQLVSKNLTDRISSDELESEMAELRNSFKQDSLVIDPDVADLQLDELTFSSFSSRLFVRQLEIVKQSRRAIFFAVRDYFRAFEQRSRWLRSDLLHVGELQTYERRLIEEWEVQFQALVDALSDSPAEEAMLLAANDVLAWARDVNIPIRPAVTERFVTRGSLHMLSDKLQVGWHPKFKKLLV
jgi:hypothetical protein